MNDTQRLYVIGFDPPGFGDKTKKEREELIEKSDGTFISNVLVPIGHTFKDFDDRLVEVVDHELGGKILICRKAEQ